jgi:hypothetical protein
LALEICLLHEHLAGLTGAIFMEFSIPRMGRRIDAVLLIGPIVFVVEFKIGEATFDRSSLDQVWDYALDLKNFHQASHAAPIAPVLIATGAEASPAVEVRADADGVFRPIPIRSEDFRLTLDRLLVMVKGEPLNADQWARAPYLPTPTIVEAARALYAQHSVEAIARYDAGAQNLHATSGRIEELVDDARVRRRKLICFVTGVPGAGKTLAGLNIATQRRDAEQATHAVFLSGNGPLVAVLREALTRDELARQRSQGARVRKSAVSGQRSAVRSSRIKWECRTPKSEAESR